MGVFRILPAEFCNFEFLRVLGKAPTHGSDVGECIEVAGKIKVNDGESWWRCWSEAAEKAEATAALAANSGDRIAARWAYLRASEYHRSSELMLRKPEPHSDPRQLEIITRSIENFKKACTLFDTPVEHLEIPFGPDGGTLPAYLFLPAKGPDGDTTGKIPVAVQVQGYDTTKEEFYHFTVAGALPRGYAVLVFDGPGQGLVSRREKHRMFLRGDFEVVVQAALDALWAHAASSPACANLDLDRVALLGNSMGGYFALRGAAHDPDQRIKACVASDGFYDIGASGRERMPGFFKYLSRGMVESIMGLAMRLSPYQVRWELGHGLMAFGAQSVLDVLDKAVAFTLDRPDGTSVLADVKCPVLVTDAPDGVFGQRADARRIYDNLTQLKDGETKVMWCPIGVGQGSLQAKVAAFSHLHSRLFAWLDKVFGIERPPIAEK